MTTQQIRREAMKWQRAGYPARVVYERGERRLCVHIASGRNTLGTVATSRRVRMPVLARQQQGA